MTEIRMAELVNQILKSRAYVDFARAFGHTTGLSVHLVPAISPDPPSMERHHKFCRLMASNPATCKMCVTVDCGLQSGSHNRSRTETCFAGFSETAVPVRLGNTTFALLRTGEISLTPVNARSLAAVKERLGEPYQQLFDARLEKAYLATPVVPWRDYDEIIRLLTVFSTQLSSQAAQFPEQKVDVEPKEILRARRYIEEHCNEPIRLKQVAMAVNMSEFYFCRHFRKITGTTFTDFVTRVRLEKARELLLDPQRRISEVAFEVGFQSLSQFNRSFRKCFGCSPKDIRLLANAPA